LSDHIKNLVIFICTYFLLPVSVGISVSFYSQLGAAGIDVRNIFFAGLFSFLVLYLFVWEPHFLHDKGQSFIGRLCSFSPSFANSASFFVSAYTALFLIIFVIFSLIIRTHKYDSVFIFIIGLSIGLYLVFTAKNLKSQLEDFVSSRYFFTLEVAYMINLTIVAFVFNYLFKSFSFVKFFQLSLKIAGDIYYVVFGQLFFVS